MRDKAFLAWLHERLEHVHNENPQTDYMGKLRSIIAATPADLETPNTAPELDAIRFADVVMTVGHGETLMLSGRRWIVEIEEESRTSDPLAPTTRIFFTDLASPGFTREDVCEHDYGIMYAHIRLLTVDGEKGAALATRARWANAFREQAYTLDILKPVVPV